MNTEFTFTFTDTKKHIPQIIAEALQ